MGRLRPHPSPGGVLDAAAADTVGAVAPDVDTRAAAATDDEPADTATGDRLAQRLQAVRDRSRRLCHGLTREDCALQSMPDASPIKWHLAHTTWFFETFVLLPGLPGYEPFDPSFRHLYNSYYDGVGPQFPRAQRGLISRPSLDEVWLYRAGVDAALQRWLRLRGGDGLAADDRALFELGLAHEEQHQELMLTDLLHLLSVNPALPAYREVPTASAAAVREGGEPGCADAGGGWSGFDAGVVEVGRDAGGGFCFDNETPRHRVFVEAFELADAPVTNREYQAFVDEGGYDDPRLWLSEGFATAQAQRWRAPMHWSRRGVDGRWHAFTLHGELPLEPDAPVCHLSLYEADAYARWAGARLPGEHEWERAAAGRPVRGQFADDAWLLPRPTGPGRLAGLYGGVWEWTSSSYAPYPGFAPRRDAIGEYNGKFMVNQYVLRGGSCATPPGHLRSTYRNFFPAWARWQFAGVRLARSVR